MTTNKNMPFKITQKIVGIFDLLPKVRTIKQKKHLKRMLIGPTKMKFENNVANTKIPKIMMIGRSGHGKSSTINAIADKDVTIVSDVRPGQLESISLYVEPPGFKTRWEFIDTRGFFDPVNPDGSIVENAEKQLTKDILQHKPNLFIHVINVKEIRTLSNDIETFNRICKKIKKKLRIPALIVLSHCDILGKRTEWPLISNSNKAIQLRDAMQYLTVDILKIEHSEAIVRHSPLNGFLVKDDLYFGVVPTCTQENDCWNIETLRVVIERKLNEIF